VTPTRALGALALLVALAHAPFLASSLEDIDSVNFALGVRDFDVADHRPHPPGYPVYIAIGKVLAALVGAMPAAGLASAIEARALAWLSLLAAVVSVFLLYRVFAALAPVRASAPPWSSLHPTALGATALTLASPLVWTLAARPMSDLPGLALALAAQACLLTAWWWQTPETGGERRLSPELLARSGRMIVVGALVAGVAVGLRTQTLWLTAPLLALVLVDRIGRGVAGAIIGAGMTFTIGCLAWAIPLVAASGGLQGYLTALGTQAGEDFAGGEMLYVNPAPRLVAFALLHTFVDPWEWVPLAAVVLALAALGAAALLLRDRRSLAVVIAITAPYLVFHLLFQDTAFVRYAVPFVPVVAWLAVSGITAVAPRLTLPGAVAVSLVAAVVGGRALVGYSGTSAPAIQAVAAMNGRVSTDRPGALAMHQTFQRPLQAELVGVQPQLPSPPRREWLALERYWLDGHEAAVWFLADPRRTDLALIDPQSRRDVTTFRWRPSESRSFGGMRPAAVDWVRMTAPGWFAEEGWSLTPETAGMAALAGRSPHLGPIVARVRRRDGPARVLIGGRNLAGPSDPAARFTLALDGRPVETWDVAPGFFLRAVDLPAGHLIGEGTFAALTIQSTAVAGEAPIPTAIEQFDVQGLDTVMWGYGDGWHEAEYSPALGVWRWSSERAVVHVFGAHGPVRLTLRIESPGRYFDGPSSMTVTTGARTLATSSLLDDDSVSIDVPMDALAAADGRIVLATSQIFVPAERGGGADKRQLGLRVFDLRVEPAGLR
jgi:hypothetical protein